MPPTATAPMASASVGTGKQRATEDNGGPATAPPASGGGGGGGGGGASTSTAHRRGQEWFYTTGLPSDVVIEVEEVSFHLHKFPLLSRSGRLARVVAELVQQQESSGGGDGSKTALSMKDAPGGAEAFEICAKFCYGVKVQLNAGNVAPVRCCAEYLEMTEDVAEDNLVGKADAFLDQVVLRSWKDSLRTLQACQDPFLAPHAERLGIVRRLVDAIASKAFADPGLVGWGDPQHVQPTSPGGSILWNGISTGATRARNSTSAPGRSEWWYADLAALQLPCFQQVIAALLAKGMRPESVAGALVHYAKKHIPGLQKRHAAKPVTDSGRLLAIAGNAAAAGVGGNADDLDQRELLEAVEQMLPAQSGVTSTRFLFGMLRTAMILNANPVCKSNLERRIGMQLEQATLDDLLMPNYSFNGETLYDVDAVQRILDHFLLLDQPPQAQQQHEDVQLVRSPSLNPVFIVAKHMDAYLAEVAPDANLKPAKFQALAEALPDYARLMDDGLYRAVDIYLKSHPWLMEHERERLCRVMDCQKLSLEACTHAAQNERLPLRVVVQVLFFEQLQLRTAIAGCFHVGDNVEHNSRPNPIPGADNSGSLLGGAGGAVGGAGGPGPLANVVRENQVLKVDMDKMRARVGDLERECAFMRAEIQKLGKSKGRAFKSFDLTKLGCSGQGDSGMDNPDLGTGIEHPPLPKPHRRQSASLS